MLQSLFKPCLLAVLFAGAAQAASERPTPCTAAWYDMMAAEVPTGDGRGHGPDVGSGEWMSVVEFRLGLRDAASRPERGSEAWCRWIDRTVQARMSGPSFSCAAVEADSIEAMICADPGLSALDRRLDAVYRAAQARAHDQHPPRLKAEQIGWIKGRNACWKAEDMSGCVRTAYRDRIAELQARYRLVPATGPVRFACDGNPANEVVVTFFDTEPPVLIAERGDQVSLMQLAPSGSGTRYAGRNESFWEHQGEARVVWGYGSSALHCVRMP